MFPRDVAEVFEREYGCTEADWARCLPVAVRSHPLRVGAAGAAEVGIGAGTLALGWVVLPERRIGLARLPRMRVSFRFHSVDAAARREFMRWFDLSMQRGGG